MVSSILEKVLSLINEKALNHNHKKPKTTTPTTQTTTIKGKTFPRTAGVRIDCIAVKKESKTDWKVPTGNGFKFGIYLEKNQVKKPTTANPTK